MHAGSYAQRSHFLYRLDKRSIEDLQGDIVGIIHQGRDVYKVIITQGRKDLNIVIALIPLRLISVFPSEAARRIKHV